MFVLLQIHVTSYLLRLRSVSTDPLCKAPRSLELDLVRDVHALFGDDRKLVLQRISGISDVVPEATRRKQECP